MTKEYFDHEVFDAIEKEAQRQKNNIELIASENFVSKEVLEAQGSILTNKYAEGYPGKRYYGGCEFVDIVEQLAIDRAKELFDAEYVNVQPHSGSNANSAVFQALLKPGDTYLGMELSHGGHLTHGSPVNFSGKLYNVVAYGLTDDEEIDYENLLEIAKEHKPKMIIAGYSAYSRILDFEKFREIADEVGAYLMVDMAHFAGLVAAGLHPNPVPYADVVTSTTHKTLRGPRGGIILSRDAELGKKFRSSIFPGTQGGPLEHVIAGKAVAFKEALQPEFKEYQQQVLDNAKAMAEVFNNHDKARVITGGTDNHLLLLDVTGFNLTGKQAETLLDEVQITVNKNTIPFETESPMVTSGVRLGTPAITTRGFDVEDTKKVTELIIRTLEAGEDISEDERQQIIEEVNALTEANPLYSN